MPVLLRAETEDDLPFLRRLYGSTREEELAPVPWTAAEKAAFLDQQFAAQRAHYRAHYVTAHFGVLEMAGDAVGRLYVDHWLEETRIMDIALLPAARGRGLGTAILRSLQEEARVAGRKLSIHVEMFNPALRLYERLGFVRASEQGVHWRMEWSPAVS